MTLERSPSLGRQGYTDELCDALREHSCDAIVMAGFDQVLGKRAFSEFPKRILNTHPSLLPSFPGKNAVDQALAHGVKITGCTVHFVDEGIDSGPIVAQAPVPVMDQDTMQTLLARIIAREQRLYPRVIAALAAGSIQLHGRQVIWKSE